MSTKKISNNSADESKDSNIPKNEIIDQNLMLKSICGKSSDIIPRGSTVRRCLFPVHHEKTELELNKSLEKIYMESSKKWNYDFQNDEFHLESGWCLDSNVPDFYKNQNTDKFKNRVPKLTQDEKSIEKCIKLEHEDEEKDRPKNDEKFIIPFDKNPSNDLIQTKCNSSLKYPEQKSTNNNKPINKNSAGLSVVKFYGEEKMEVKLNTISSNEQINYNSSSSSSSSSSRVLNSSSCIPNSSSTSSSSCIPISSSCLPISSSSSNYISSSEDVNNSLSKLEKYPLISNPVILELIEDDPNPIDWSKSTSSIGPIRTKLRKNRNSNPISKQKTKTKNNSGLRI